MVDNDISASRHSKKARPGFTDIQARLAGGNPVDILWAWESSRITRDLEVYGQVRSLCESYGVLWSYHGRTYDMSDTSDRFTTALDALVSERSSDETRDRVLRAVRSRVEQGRAHGRLTYGYRAVYDQYSGAPIGREPDPEQAPIVKEIVRRVLAGDPNYRIIADLNGRGVPSPHLARLIRTGGDVTTARRWTIDQVRRIAESPTIAGLRTHKDVVVGDATWEPIISMEDHRAVVVRFSDPARVTTRDREIKHLLSGVARCGVCGAACRWVRNNGSHSYACRGGRGTYCVVRLEKPVDAFVTETILQRLDSPDAARMFVRDDEAVAVSAASRELVELEARLEEFRMSAERPDGIPVEVLARMEAKYAPLIEDARRRALPGHVPTVVMDLLGADDVRGHWHDVLGVAQRREVVKHLVEVTIHPILRRGPAAFDASRIQIVWRGPGV